MRREISFEPEAVVSCSLKYPAMRASSLLSKNMPTGYAVFRPRNKDHAQYSRGFWTEIPPKSTTRPCKTRFDFEFALRPPMLQLKNQKTRINIRLDECTPQVSTNASPALKAFGHDSRRLLILEDVRTSARLRTCPPPAWLRSQVWTRSHSDSCMPRPFCLVLSNHEVLTSLGKDRQAQHAHHSLCWPRCSDCLPTAIPQGIVEPQPVLEDTEQAKHTAIDKCGIQLRICTEDHRRAPCKQ